MLTYKEYEKAVFDWLIAKNKATGFTFGLRRVASKGAETDYFVDNSFKNGEIQSAGTSFAKILPPVSRFSPTGDLAKKKETVLEKFKAYFDRYFNIS